MPRSHEDEAGAPVQSGRERPVVVETAIAPPAPPVVVAPPVVDDPDVKVQINPDFELPKDADSVAVAVPGLDPKADYTDEDNRVVLSKGSTVTVPASVAAELTSSPAVVVAD